ncbi:hypothetical protein [Streptomyces sp. NPDC055189]
MKRLAYVFGGSAAAGAAAYLVVYLYRWQWQRAILCGVLLLVVEILLLGATLVGRIARVEDRLRDADRRQEDVLARLRQDAAPGQPGSGGPGLGKPGLGAGAPRFRWLDDDPAGHTYVFVPVLMATGALLSGLAWLVQRIASATARPAAEHRLAGRLAVLAAPPPDTGLEDLPPVAARLDRRRAGRALAAGAVGAVLLGAAVAGLAELTQTREGDRSEAAATSVLLHIDMRGRDATPERRSLAARQLWERCRDSTSVALRHATLGPLGDDMFAGVVRPALTEHDRMRLRGCLEDTGLDKARLTVTGIGDTGSGDD